MARPRLPFALIKDSVSFRDVCILLRVPVKQKTGPLKIKCPSCEHLALSLTDGHGFKCHACSTHGTDAIALYALFKKVGMYEAASDLMTAFSIGQQDTTIPCTMPTEADPSPTPNQKTNHPFDAIAETLQYDHPALSEKLPVEEATRYGIGFKKTNVMRGLILIPLRDETGTVIRCLGLTPEAFADTTLGKPFDLSSDSNVVSFPKKTA